jgi:uncharacterized protein YndB with AHSA1/START domain
VIDMKHITMRRRIVGRTKGAGFEIGVRQTFSVSPQQAWSVITSDEGIKLWLGDAPGLRLEKGETYHTHDGTSGEFRVVNPGGHLRLTWQPKDWGTASTLQVRIIPRGAKTVISFHQEQLRGEEEREQMQRRWLTALEKLRSRLE